MDTATPLFFGVRMARKCLTLGHWPRVRRCASCHLLSAIAVIACIDTSQRCGAKAGARRRARFKSHLVVNLGLVGGQHQKIAVVVAANVLGFCAMVWWQWWRRRRTWWRGHIRTKRTRRDGWNYGARGRDVGVSAGPRPCCLQLNIFKGELARVAFPAINAARRLHRSAKTTERDVPNSNVVGRVSFRATRSPKSHETSRPVSVAF